MKKNLKTLFVANLIMAGAVTGAIGDFNAIGSEVVYASESTTKAVNVDYLNVRATANKNAKILGVIKRGDVLNITDVVYGWNKFTYNGQTAYVDGGFLTTTIPTSTPAVAPTVVAPTTTVVDTFTPVAKSVNVHSVNFRSGASNNASIISVLKEGQVFTVIDVVQGWNKIVVDGKEGYVYGRYLTATSDTPVVAPVVVETPVVEASVIELPVVEKVDEVPVVTEPEIVEEAPVVTEPEIVEDVVTEPTTDEVVTEDVVTEPTTDEVVTEDVVTEPTTDDVATEDVVTEPTDDVVAEETSDFDHSVIINLSHSGGISEQAFQSKYTENDAVYFINEVSFTLAPDELDVDYTKLSLFSDNEFDTAYKMLVSENAITDFSTVEWSKEFKYSYSEDLSFVVGETLYADTNAPFTIGEEATNYVYIVKADDATATPYELKINFEVAK